MIRAARYTSIAAAVLGLLASSPTGALAQADHEQHHPQGGAAPGSQAEPAPSNKDAGTSDMSKSGMMGGGMMGNMMQGGGMMGMMQGCSMMGTGSAEAQANGRISFLKTELAITDAQKDVWEAYAAALAKNLVGMSAMPQSMMKMMEAKSPVDRLDQHVSAMEGRVAALKETKPALSNLYAALSDKQKKTADHLLATMDCMM